VLLLDLMKDVRGHLKSEAHQSRATTYQLMRKLYVLSHGRSQTVWRLMFRTLRRSGPRVPGDLGIADEVRRHGYAIRPGFISDDGVLAIRRYLECQPGRPRTGLRIDYSPEVILDAPGMSQLLSNPELLAAARNYLGAQPIFAGVSSWQSLHDATSTDDDYSDAAQLYHFDCDWPLFIKFFIYLTDVSAEDGPFAIIEGTHRHKPVWRDGRFGSVELLEHHALADKERRITGKRGTLIAADTSALHRGTPVARGPRMVLQLEFAITRLGASRQYPLLPTRHRPKSGHVHTYDVFAAT
jgi:hypothetical protein